MESSTISRIYIRNYKDQSMQIGLNRKPDPRENFAGFGLCEYGMLRAEKFLNKNHLPKAETISMG